MKATKDREQSLLLNVFGLKEKHYLGISTLLFSDLSRPEALLQEKEMWLCIKDQLGKGKVLDQSMPKPRGEVLVVGKCFAPDGRPWPASQVSFRVGTIGKTLYVFGNRYWKRAGGPFETIMDPEPFTEMPIAWENAFGGKGFDRNPVGKGFWSEDEKDRPEKLPLPNMEDPGRLITSHTDRPEPAGFAAYDMTGPQRRKKFGTFDDRWFRERWPWFPDDVDFSAFNAAPPDQQMEGYFKGDEGVEIKGMHPKQPLIQSHLPAVRIRCFLTLLKSLNGDPAETLFKEVEMRLDTVWLFPSVLKGIVIFHGVSEIADDEYSDVQRIFLVTEKLGDQPKSLEYYMEEQKKRLDRTVKIDQAKMDKAKERLAAAMNKVLAIPKKFEEIQAVAFGKAPVMSTTVAEQVAKAQAQLAEHSARLDKMEALAAEMRGKYGHKVKIKTDGIQKMWQTIASLSQKLPEIQKNAETKLAEAEAAKKNMEKRLKARAEDLKKKGVDIDEQVDNLILGPPEVRWRKKGFDFVCQCRRNLEAGNPLMGALLSNGLSRKTIQSAFLGVNPDKEEHERKLWGLKLEPDGEGGEKPLIIPAGLVIPRFVGADLDKIVIRPGDALESSKDSLVKGSNEVPLVLGAGEGKPFVRVPDELDALLVHQEAGDLCATISLMEPGQKPDKETGELLKESPALLVVFPAGIPQEQGNREWEAWKKAYPQAVRGVLPLGNRPIEARKQGVDLRQWIRESLPPEVSKTLPPEIKQVTAEDIKPGFVPAMNVDVKGMIAGFRKKADALASAKKAEAEAAQKAMMEKVKAQLAGRGIDLEDVMAKAQAQPQGDNLVDAAPMIAALNAKRQQLQKMGLLTPEVEQKFLEAEASAGRMAEWGNQKYKDGMAKLAEAKDQLAGKSTPEWAKKTLEKFGLEPEDREPMTREKVVKRHGRGKGFGYLNLSGLDLSGLDLHGIDLRKANCNKTIFAGANLEGAILSEAFFKEADFSKAVLRNARMEQGLFTQAKFVGADLSGAFMLKAMLKKVDLTGANLEGATLELTMVAKAVLKKAKLRRTSARLSMIRDSDLSEADFSEAKFDKALIRGSNLTGASFANSVGKAASFKEVKGEKVSFAGADLHNGRFGPRTSLPEADFKGASFDAVCLMDSEFPKADFRGSKMEKGLIQGCNLKGANFHRVPAKRTRFNKSDLSGADMRGANLHTSSLRKARLVETDLTAANLYGVDFFKATLGNTKLDRANLKRSLLEKRADLLPEEDKGK